jgi:hypothetical protein
MVKLADQARINRREFIDEYRGYELDPTWLDRMAEKPGRGWQALMERSGATRSRNCAPTWRRSASMSASTSRNSAAS